MHESKNYLMHYQYTTMYAKGLTKKICPYLFQSAKSTNILNKLKVSKYLLTKEKQ